MKGRNPKIAIVGGTYMDMAIRCSQIPTIGQYVAGSALSYAIAGPGPVQAVQASLCGCEVSLISKVGGDPFSKYILDGLADYKINTSFVQVVKAKNTGTHVTMVNAEGENAGCSYSGANCALVPKDITAAEEVISQADVCLMHGELPQETVVEAIRCTEQKRFSIRRDPSNRKARKAERFHRNIFWSM
jgi:ribokinase